MLETKKGKTLLDFVDQNSHEIIKQYLTKQNLATSKTHLP